MPGQRCRRAPAALRPPEACGDGWEPLRLGLGHARAGHAVRTGAPLGCAARAESRARAPMAARSLGRSHLESVGARDAAGLLHAEALGSGRRHLASLRQGGSGAARGRGRKKRLGAARDLRSRPERGWPEACIRPASAPMRLTLRPRTVMSYCLTSRTRLRGARSLRGKARADAKSQAARWRRPLVLHG